MINELKIYNKKSILNNANEFSKKILTLKKRIIKKESNPKKSNLFFTKAWK